jgi:hypothetical protein
VINNAGGTLTVGAFGVSTSAGGLTFGAGAVSGDTTTYTSQVINATGSKTLRESDIAGYAEGTWSCTGAAPSNNTITAGAVTVPPAVNVVCTIINDDIAGTLQIVKRVVNNNGGTATVGAFGISTSAGALSFGAAVVSGDTATYSSQVISVIAGSKTLRENDIAGYTEGTWSCTPTAASPTSISAGAVTVALATNVVCTIINNDDPGRIIIQKISTGAVSSFNFTTSSTPSTKLANPIVITTLVAGQAKADTTSNLNAGSYSVIEDIKAGFALTELLRACGGCLGARRRRRAWKTAISSGEWSNAC